MLGALKSQRRQQNLAILSNDISKRCYTEMIRAWLAHKGNNDKYFSAVERARATILPCFQGAHKNCHTHSSVCNAATRKQFVPRHLPGNKYLVMTESDKSFMSNVIDYKMSKAMVQKQLNRSSTNKVEAIHKKVFKAVPKSNTFSCNVFGRAHSQILEATLGLKQCTVTLCREACVPLKPDGSGKNVLEQMNARDTYSKLYRQRPETKARRTLTTKE